MIIKFDEAFKKIDLMVRFEQAEIVQTLHKQFFMVNGLRSHKDYSKKFGDDYRLFVDSGKLNHSVIYQEAMDQINYAENTIVFMSQFVPDGSLLKRLISATKRGVRVEVLTSPKTNVIFTQYPTKLAYKYFIYKISKHPLITCAHLSQDVHAKLLLIDDKKALCGSHNYTYSGVLFGTEEIMMETTDQMLLNQIRSLLSSSKSSEKPTD